MKLNEKSLEELNRENKRNWEGEGDRRGKGTSSCTSELSEESGKSVPRVTSKEETMTDNSFISEKTESQEDRLSEDGGPKLKKIVSNRKKQGKESSDGESAKETERESSCESGSVISAMTTESEERVPGTEMVRSGKRCREGYIEDNEWVLWKTFMDQGTRIIDTDWECLDEQITWDVGKKRRELMIRAWDSERDELGDGESGATSEWMITAQDRNNPTIWMIYDTERRAEQWTKIQNAEEIQFWTIESQPTYWAIDRALEAMRSRMQSVEKLMTDNRMIVNATKTREKTDPIREERFREIVKDKKVLETGSDGGRTALLATMELVHAASTGKGGGVIMVQGPAGTGKSRVMTEVGRACLKVANENQKYEQPAKIMINCGANKAVQSCTDRLVESGEAVVRFVSEEYMRGKTNATNKRNQRPQELVCDFEKIVEVAAEDGWGSARSYLEEKNKPPHLKDHELTQNKKRKIMQKVVHVADFISCTSAHALGIPLDAATIILLLMDENARDAEHEDAMSYAAAGETNRDLVVYKCGDTKQGKPFCGLRSRMERASDEGVDITLLERAYRCSKMVCELLSELFYEGKLEYWGGKEGRGVEAKYAFHDEKGSEVFVAHVQVKGGTKPKGGPKTLIEPRNEEACRRIVRMLEKAGVDTEDIGIGTIYRAHADRMNMNGLDAQTTEECQGIESQIWMVNPLLWTDVGSTDFQEAKERANVLMSRAKSMLIMIWDDEAIKLTRKEGIWRKIRKKFKGNMHELVLADRPEDDVISMKVTRIGVKETNRASREVKEAGPRGTEIYRRLVKRGCMRNEGWFGDMKARQDDSRKSPDGNQGSGGSQHDNGNSPNGNQESGGSQHDNGNSPDGNQGSGGSQNDNGKSADGNQGSGRGQDDNGNSPDGSQGSSDSQDADKGDKGKDSTTEFPKICVIKSKLSTGKQYEKSPKKKGSNKKGKNPGKTLGEEKTRCEYCKEAYLHQGEVCKCWGPVKSTGKRPMEDEEDKVKPKSQKRVRFMDTDDQNGENADTFDEDDQYTDESTLIISTDDEPSHREQDLKSDFNPTDFDLCGLDLPKDNTKAKAIYEREMSEDLEQQQREDTKWKRAKAQIGRETSEETGLIESISGMIELCRLTGYEKIGSVMIGMTETYCCVTAWNEGLQSNWRVNRAGLKDWTKGRNARSTRAETLWEEVTEQPEESR